MDRGFSQVRDALNSAGVPQKSNISILPALDEMARRIALQHLGESVEAGISASSLPHHAGIHQVPQTRLMVVRDEPINSVRREKRRLTCPERHKLAGTFCPLCAANLNVQTSNRSRSSGKEVANY